MTVVKYNTLAALQRQSRPASIAAAAAGKCVRHVRLAAAPSKMRAPGTPKHCYCCRGPLHTAYGCSRAQPCVEAAGLPAGPAANSFSNRALLLLAPATGVPLPVPCCSCCCCCWSLLVAESRLAESAARSCCVAGLVTLNTPSCASCSSDNTVCVGERGGTGWAAGEGGESLGCAAGCWFCYVAGPVTLRTPHLHPNTPACHSSAQHASSVSSQD
jgi:hypothetical protein